MASGSPLTPQVDRPDLRIGTPERSAAAKALDVHLAERRIDTAERQRRQAACQQATTRSELLRVFADLPAPHPDLPGPPGHPTDDPLDAGDDIPPLVGAVLLTLVLGLPLGVVMGIAYGAWWTLTLPVAVAVTALYVEHLLSRLRER